MSFDIRVISTGSKGSSMNKNSVGNKSKNIREAKDRIGNNLSTKISGYMGGVDNALSLAMGKGAGVGLTKVAGATGAIIAVGVGVSSKTHDLYMGIQQSKTGNSVHYSNIKVKKQAIMSLGMNYVSGSFKNYLNTRHEVARENMAINYNREIYNLNNYGEKNKIR